MQDLQRFAEQLTGLAETLGAEMSTAKMLIYEHALKRYSDEQVSNAMSKAACTLRFFPKPVELIELIEGKKDEQSTLAWETLIDTMQHVGAYQSVLFDDGRLGKTVKLLGGWEKLCHSEIKYVHLLRNDFVKIFNSLGFCEPEITGGIGGKKMANSGFAHLASPPLRIECSSCRCGGMTIADNRGDPAHERLVEMDKKSGGVNDSFGH